MCHSQGPQLTIPCLSYNCFSAIQAGYIQAATHLDSPVLPQVQGEYHVSLASADRGASRDFAVESGQWAGTVEFDKNRNNWGQTTQSL